MTTHGAAILLRAGCGYASLISRVDYDGDGIAELRKVCSIGNVILANEEADLIPFAAITPIVFPHRHIGIGYDDLCEQPSAVKTALIRLLPR